MVQFVGVCVRAYPRKFNAVSVNNKPRAVYRRRSKQHIGFKLNDIVPRAAPRKIGVRKVCPRLIIVVSVLAVYRRPVFCEAICLVRLPDYRAFLYRNLRQRIFFGRRKVVSPRDIERLLACMVGKYGRYIRAARGYRTEEFNRSLFEIRKIEIVYLNLRVAAPADVFRVYFPDQGNPVASVINHRVIVFYLIKFRILNKNRPRPENDRGNAARVSFRVVCIYVELDFVAVFESRRRDFFAVCLDDEFSEIDGFRSVHARFVEFELNKPRLPLRMPDDFKRPRDFNPIVAAQSYIRGGNFACFVTDSADGPHAENAERSYAFA